jgi:hypothetical protein
MTSNLMFVLTATIHGPDDRERSSPTKLTYGHTRSKVKTGTPEPTPRPCPPISTRRKTSPAHGGPRPRIADLDARSPCLSTSSADSFVSLTHRPELAAIPEPASPAAAPVLTTPRNVDKSKFLLASSLSEARKRSTAAASPMTARPSPSLIS